MRPHDHTLNRTQVHRSATRYLQDYVPIRDYKRKVTAQTLWAVLLVAATGVTSVHAACQRLEDIASEETIRKALISRLPEFAELQRQLNRALAGRLPRALRRRKQRLAIDLTLIPYHGEPFRDESEVYRGQAKQGTSHFHAYATAYVILKGQRFTVALTAVTKGEAMKDVLQRLLKQARSVGVKARLVLLDRGFYSVEVIRYLQAARQPFLMPVVIRGLKASDPRGPSGTRVFAAMKRSGWFEYMITSGSKRTARVSICVSCRNYRGRWKRHGRWALVYACWGVEGRSCVWVRETYRTRFGRVRSRPCQGLCGFSRASLLGPLLSSLFGKPLRLQVGSMHFRPHTAQIDHPKVDDPLTPLHTPRHPRTLQSLAEYRLARRLRHTAADRQMVPAVDHVVQMLDVIPKVAVRLPVRLGLTQHRPPAPDRRRRV
jgi:hypothetical protein